MDLKNWYAKAEAVVDCGLARVGRVLAWLVSSPWTAGVTLAVVVVLLVATCSVAR